MPFVTMRAGGLRTQVGDGGAGSAQQDANVELPVLAVGYALRYNAGRRPAHPGDGGVGSVQ